MVPDARRAPLPSFMRRTEAELWRDLENTYCEDADFIRRIRLEEKDEAIQRSSPTEFDETIKKDIKHSHLVPFRRTDDMQELREHFDYARNEIKQLKGDT